MKVLSIQQPWGTLICSGLKDVENRKWALKYLPLTVAIHVGAKRHNIDEDTMPLAWNNPIENLQTMGGMGRIKDLPTSAVIGIATIDRCDTNNMSVWAQRGPGAEYQWVMRDVKLFKEPITGIKGKLGIFDIPEVNPGNLPECVDIPQIERNRTHLRIPLNADLFKAMQDGKEDTVEFNLLDENLSLFTDDNLNPKVTETVTFVCGEKSFDADIKDYQVITITDPATGDVMEYEDAHGGTYYWYRIAITIE